jgi:hypothetical protein
MLVIVAQIASVTNCETKRQKMGFFLFFSFFVVVVLTMRKVFFSRSRHFLPARLFDLAYTYAAIRAK